MHICRICNVGKTLDLFPKNARYKNGKDTICKRCASELSKKVRDKNREYYKEYDVKRKREDIKYIFIRRYSSMKFRVSRGYMKGRGDNIPDRDSFMEWCYDERIYKQFMAVYTVYKESGYKRNLIPTLDRIDTFKGYDLGNLQWMSHKDNVIKMFYDYGKR